VTAHEAPSAAADHIAADHITGTARQLAGQMTDWMTGPADDDLVMGAHPDLAEWCRNAWALLALVARGGHDE